MEKHVKIQIQNTIYEWIHSIFALQMRKTTNSLQFLFFVFGSLYSRWGKSWSDIRAVTWMTCNQNAPTLANAKTKFSIYASLNGFSCAFSYSVCLKYKIFSQSINLHMNKINQRRWKKLFGTTTIAAATAAKNIYKKMSRQRKKQTKNTKC